MGRQGHRETVVTSGASGLAATEVVNRVRVVRIETGLGGTVGGPGHWRDGGAGGPTACDGT